MTICVLGKYSSYFREPKEWVKKEKKWCQLVKNESKSIIVVELTRCLIIFLNLNIVNNFETKIVLPRLYINYNI